MSRTLRYLLVVGGGVISILLFLLASASENSALFEQHYPWLLFLNGLAAISLLGLVLLLLTVFTNDTGAASSAPNCWRGWC